MKGVVLAAGRGTRLEPITSTTPKPLLRFLGKPYAQLVLERLHEAGIYETFVLVPSGHRELFRDSLTPSHLVEQSEPKGTAHAVSLALSHARGATLVQYGDNMFKTKSLRDILAVHAEAKNIATIAVAKVDNPSKYGAVKVDGRGRVLHIEEKSEQPTSNLAFVGLMVLEPDFLKYSESVDKSPRGELELTDALNRAATSSEVGVVDITGAVWHDLTYPWDILSIHEEMINEMPLDVEGEVEQGVVIKGSVYIGEGSRVKSGTYIEGPVWIGKHVTVGPNSYLRPFTAVDDGCRIGSACEVKASVVYQNTHISHLSYVGDSVIAESVNLGAGTITANLRFDERAIKVNVNGVRVNSGRSKLGCFIGAGVKTGINVSLNPGVKVGQGAYILPGTVVRTDVAPYSIYPPKAA
ncbi:MAG: sugar phosphate nucleotidyltransferase [Candidatus Marsarchaeota archaeon]|nr:sugar phosphate nucleotidyltransferase [Candidatus Marsarchaeota archaeon]